MDEETEDRETEKGEGREMVIKSAGQADTAEHSSIQRDLPGDCGSRQAIV